MTDKPKPSDAWPKPSDAWPKPSLAWRIIRGILLVIVLIPVLFVGSCTYAEIRKGDAGKEWCEQIIAGVEREGETFIANHPDKPRDGLLSMEKGGSNPDRRARFRSQPNGEYRCSYVSFGKVHEYRSEIGTWEYLD